MMPNAHQVQEPAAGATVARLAEAARYTLLRRLAPSMRHHLVVNLQPIGMIYEVMDRRLKAPQPDLADVHDSAQKINGFAKAALNSCLDVVTWLAPDDEMRTSAEAGVRECLGLVATSLTFRGYNLRNEVQGLAGEVRRSSMRNVLTAALLYATDHTLAPADITLSARSGARDLTLMLTLRPTDGEPSFIADPPYRRLDWTDLEALAAAESGAVARDGTLQLQLTLPWQTAPAAG
ncbi:hypothetical protein [Ramlibacter sp.]|uniref:hypothetical protein n=1 Tax=Ramlibacter sp. TaxID=1917967 RepID=UPI002D04C746|nr:hypothetical protein [Ramlibacter sp.]HWI84618.1 hypothetical protein [Ramlibacter sp.]